MSDSAILAGPAIRRLRRREGLTQTAMAARLGISPSYLNLVERNQRPLSARLVVQLAEQFDFDPRLLRQGEAVGGIDGLRRRLADPRFADLGIDRDELAEWLASAPNGAIAFARLFDAGGSAASAPAEADPLALVRAEIERWRNHFADLDAAAEALADELRLSSADLGAALAERLRQQHHLAVRVLPVEVMPDDLRRLDLHARQVQLSELLDAPARTFQLAVQLALLEQRDAIAALANAAQFTDRTAWRLLRRHLAGYFAAALVMPYGRFLRACEATGYDLPLLQRRFGVSFEQLAHRLTTLQRVGQRGLPFFMARLDRAGQVSKRLAGGSGAALLEGGTQCPLWAIHAASGPEPRAQSLEFIDEDGAASHWFTLAQGVRGSDGMGRHVVAVGLDAALAGALAQARGHDLERSRAVRTGPGCARCRIADCTQRAVPPRGLTLDFDERARSRTPYRFAGL